MNLTNGAASDQPHTASGLSFGNVTQTNGQEPAEENPFRPQGDPASNGRQRAAEEATDAARKLAEAERKAARKKQWASHRFAAELLETLAPETWALRLKAHIEVENAARERGSKDAPKLVFTGAEAVEFGATDEQLRVMPKLTNAQITAFADEAEVQRLTAQKLAVAEATSRAQQVQWNALMGAVDGDPFLDLRAALALPPREPVWGTMIHQGSVYEVLGPPNSGKTFFIADLCAAMATGQTELLGVPLTPGNSVIVEAEGADILGMRVVAAGIKYGCTDPAEALAGKVFMTKHALNLADPAHIELIIGKITQVGASVLVIDTRARNTIGIEENSAAQMGPVYEHLAAIARRTRAAVLVIHHTAKAGDSSRGSSAATGAVDGELKLWCEHIGEDINREVHFIGTGKARLARKRDDGLPFTLDDFTIPREVYPAADHRYDKAETRNTALVMPVDPMLLPSKASRKDAAKATGNANEYAYAVEVLRFLGAGVAEGKHPPSPSALTRNGRALAKEWAEHPPKEDKGFTQATKEGVLARLAAYGMVKEVEAADLPADQRKGNANTTGKAVVLTRPEVFAATDPATDAFTPEQWAALSQAHAVALAGGSSRG